MARRAALNPHVGDWYAISDGGASNVRFEVVAFDGDEGSIELQYFDGTVMEMDLDDWRALARDGSLQPADPPEDYSGSVDVEHDEQSSLDDDGSHYSRGMHEGSYADGYDPGSGLRASSLDGLDLFE